MGGNFSGPAEQEEERGFGGLRCLSSFTGDFAGAKSNQLRLGDESRTLIGRDPISALRPEPRRAQPKGQNSRPPPPKKKRAGSIMVVPVDGSRPQSHSCFVAPPPPAPMQRAASFMSPRTFRKCARKGVARRIRRAQELPFFACCQLLHFSLFALS